MKTIFTSVLAMFLLAINTLWLNGCKKKDDPAPGLSQKIQNIVSQAALSDMKEKGMIINEGNTPPIVEGAFQVNPTVLLAPYGPNDSYKKGKVVRDFRIRLTNQKNGDVFYEEKEDNMTGSQSGTASFLSGNGNKFTLFSETTGVSSGISIKQLVVISGEISGTGIKNFQYVFTITQKNGDETNTKLIPINQARVFEDGNGLAEKVANYRLSAEIVQKNSANQRGDMISQGN
ncbi:hypothetical protein [Runella zeae]|uniref:hypothetical protein n=1 Tax=Runella zeae TaxID=94255 RepID=UPI000425A200|nr:hypothetical protein [Runella zeae]